MRTARKIDLEKTSAAGDAVPQGTKDAAKRFYLANRESNALRKEAATNREILFADMERDNRDSFTFTIKDEDKLVRLDVKKGPGNSRTVIDPKAFHEKYGLEALLAVCTVPIGEAEREVGKLGITECSSKVPGSMTVTVRPVR